MPRHPPCALSNLTTLTTKICLDARVHCAVLKVRAAHVRGSPGAVTSTVVRGRTCPGRRASSPARGELDGPKVQTLASTPAPPEVVRRCSTGPEPSGPNSVSDVVIDLEVPHDRRTGRSTDETGQISTQRCSTHEQPRWDICPLKRLWTPSSEFTDK